MQACVSWDHVSGGAIHDPTTGSTERSEQPRVARAADGASSSMAGSASSPPCRLFLCVCSLQCPHSVADMLTGTTLTVESTPFRHFFSGAKIERADRSQRRWAPALASD